LSPFNIEETQTYFGASRYLVDKARKWRKMFGILPDVPTYSKGSKISASISREVQSFYENDENSRMCPGKADCVSVKNSDGVKEHIQKRLLLGNLKELYVKYKEDVQLPVGFSSFASLRPKWCVMAGDKGTHSVCVCTHHQNPKFMISAIGVKDLTYKTLIDKAVCDSSNRNCMLQRCKKCPGTKGVSDYLHSVDVLQERESVQYCQWVSTDRSTIETFVKPVDEFIELLSSKLVILTRHHFIAKSQSSYIRSLEENLLQDEAIITGDFSENYAFVVQDSAQNFHWTNDQVTLHPFVVYNRNDKGNLDHKSFCIISDSLEHSTATVYTFQQALIEILKQKLPMIRTVHYFTDGCKAQYKKIDLISLTSVTTSRIFS
jgi:hypothetical protein